MSLAFGVGRCREAADEPTWISLFDGKTLTGWLAAGEADVFYAATDVCLAPYRDAVGSGLSASGAVTWALSSGRPIVGSKIDAFQAIQRETPCMLMTTPEQPHEIAWAVERLVADRATATRLVEAAGAYCDRHSWDAVAEQTVAVYRETMAAALKRTYPPTAFAAPVPPRETPLHESIRATQSLEGRCSLEKARALADLVLETKPACIVEIGVYGGRSLIPMALAARTYGGRVHGIDPWSNEAALEGHHYQKDRDWWSQIDIEGIYSQFLAAIRRFEVQDTVRVHRATDTAALREFADGQIGILHVDGNHSEEVSRRYIEQWGPKLAGGGYLVMDDIDWDTQLPTVSLIESLYEPVRKETRWAIYRKPVSIVESRPPLAA